MYEKFLSSRNKKGFTLVEMLIVVAIIAILIAIAIPVFSAQLEKAREGVDSANLRTVESLAVADAMLNDITADQGYYGVMGTGENRTITITSDGTKPAGFNQAKANGGGQVKVNAPWVQVDAETYEILQAKWQ